MTGRTDSQLEDILDRCLARILAGESPDAVLRDHADLDTTLRPLLTQAAALHAISIPTPAANVRTAAMSRMLAASGDAAERYQPAGVLAWLGSLRARPLAFQAIAAAIALAVLGSAGLGASAATGTTPGPVRTFFRLTDASDSDVRMQGTVVSAAADALVIESNGTQVTFVLNPNTHITRAGVDVVWSDLSAGESVDVRATRQVNGDFTAHQVRAKAAPTPEGSRAGASSTNATPPEGTPEADRTEHPEDGQGAGTPGSGDEREATPESETPRAGGGHTATPDAKHEGLPPQADATTTPGGGHPAATRTPEPTEAHEPTEVPGTDSHSSGEHTPIP